MNTDAVAIVLTASGFYRVVTHLATVPVAIQHAGRCSIVTRRNDLSVFDNYRTYSTRNASTAQRNGVGKLQKIVVPRGSCEFAQIFLKLLPSEVKPRQA